MDTPGTVLKTERERQQKPLKDVARKLKINIKYLEAIEDDDYDVLPAEVFARSYIRLYADELDLDSTKLLALFENRGMAPAAEEPEPQEQETAPPHSAAAQKSFFRPLLISVAAGLLILILFFILQDREQKHGETAPADDTTALHETKKPVIEKESPPPPALPAERTESAGDKKPVVKPEQAEINDEEKRVVQKMPEPHREKTAAEKTPIRVEKKPVDKPAAPETVYEQTAEEMTLQIVATELTWVSLSIDGGISREWHLRAGETMTLKGQRGFSGKIGNAGGTKLYFNNQDLGELGPPGKIIDITLPR
jgi:cytoskeleton protein RodZ